MDAVAALLESTTLQWVLGLAVTILAAWVVYMYGGGRRTSLRISLTEEALVDPQAMDVKMRIQVGTYKNVRNLRILRLTVRNRGPGNVEVQDPRGADHRESRPRIELPEGLRVIADPWVVGGSTAASDVRVARSLREDGRQCLHIHPHRLAAGSEIQIRILGTTVEGAVRPITGNLLRFMPGFVGNCRIRPLGLLATAERTDR